jgi:hypothetical protein
LEELDSRVEVATAGLREEAKHADDVRKQTQNCYSYICILVEVILLAILTIVYFSSDK